METTLENLVDPSSSGSPVVAIGVGLVITAICIGEIGTVGALSGAVCGYLLADRVANAILGKKKAE
ncbi:MAG: hypothetical protein HY860_04890 [Chlamydiales bacterium]|nr:hypothetical protein [Chlamydiales bacterium]